MSDFEETVYLEFQEDSPRDADSVAELLIEFVKVRRPLWDHKMPITQRSRPIRDRLWLEVVADLEGQLPLAEAQRKWRNLKDQFTKERRNIPRSGAAGNSKREWCHYKAMCFLTDCVENKKTSSNFPMACDITVAEEESQIITPLAERKRKRAISDKIDTAILKTLDSELLINPALLTVNKILQELPAAVQRKFEIEILHMAYALAEDHLDS